MRRTALIKTSTSCALLLIPALGLLLTGCAASSQPRQSIEPTWTYHDTADPLSYHPVWQQTPSPDIDTIQVVSAQRE